MQFKLLVKSLLYTFFNYLITVSKTLSSEKCLLIYSLRYLQIYLIRLKSENKEINLLFQFYYQQVITVISYS